MEWTNLILGEMSDNTAILKSHVNESAILRSNVNDSAILKSHVNETNHIYEEIIDLPCGLTFLHFYSIWKLLFL